MKLQKILPSILQSSLSAKQLDYEIIDICSDSRKITKGSIFFALSGKSFDGNKFINEAVGKGGIAVVCSKKTVIDLPENIAVIKTDNLHNTLIYCLKQFYHNFPENIFAVTGTNGKTSTAEYIRQMQKALGKKSASIGTIGINCDDQKVLKEIDNNFLTTPDIVSLYKNLAILKKYQINDVAMEASSIGIEQGRMDGLKIGVAIFTNFTQDHIDYHQNMENYFASKMLLFSKLMQNGIAILNSDIKEYQEISRICENHNHKIISYGKAGEVKLLNTIPEKSGQEIEFVIGNQNKKTHLCALGDFQAMNGLAALAAIYFYYQLSENDLDKILKIFPNLKPASGRMQKVATLKNNAEIYIDYAHTPDALENILSNSRRFVKSRLIILFGCGGDRDNKKRPIMGQVASQLADFVIITDDNPRTENAEKIRKQILESCDSRKTLEIADRKTAIAKAIQMLKPDDILIIAGKGHEKYQIIGEEKIEFDEEKIIKEFLL